jgi:hypothetical protein
MANRIPTYREFWPFYVSQHINKTNRRLHFVGTSLASATLIAAITVNWRFLIASVICGYSFAWVGHFFFERNRPATFTYPLWSLFGDFHMLSMMLRGRMENEVAKIASSGP